MKKAVFSIFLVAALLFSLTVPAFAGSTPYDELIQKGLPCDYLDSLSIEMIIHLYNKIGNNDIKNISTETVYLIENETELEMQPYADISSEALSLSIVSAEICQKNTNIITSVLVGIEWNWLNGKPTIHMADSIAVNWDSSIFYLSSDGFYSQDKWCLLGTDSWAIYKEYTRPAESNQGGIGFYTRLVSDSNFRTEVGGNAIIILEPSFPMHSVSAPKYGTSINVNYVHNRSLIIPTLSFSKTGTAIGIDTILLSDSASATSRFRYSK